MNESPAPSAVVVNSPLSEPIDSGRRSHGQVLKSSVMIGGSMGLGVVIGMARTKAMALLLGPAGVGLFGLYLSISELVRSVAGMGINTSGVRQIAESVGTGDSQRIARTVTTLRRVALVLGGLGALFLAVFARFVARVSFGDEQHAGAIAFLALAVLFGEISSAQGALIQGMRRVADLARMNILSAIFGTAFSVGIVFFYFKRGMAAQGVVPSLVCMAAMSIVTSWWFARKIKVERVSMTTVQVGAEVSGLLKLGVAFMSSGLMFMGTAYLVRAILLQRIGADAAGYYQAAWGLGGMYVGFILQAMGADFLPRLSEVAHDNRECNRLVNEQAEVGLLIAVPGLLATLSIAPFVITLFYSNRFGPAVDVLRWICLGMLLRVASWPLGSIVLAKGLRNLFFWSELLTYAAYVALVLVLVPWLGLIGSGIAFFGMYVLYWIGIYLVARRTSGFRWSGTNRKLALLFTPLVALVFVSWYVLPPAASASLGILVTLAGGFYCLRTLCVLIPLERLPRPVRKLLDLLHITPLPPHD
jgi:PST family polysaccharide transporter